MTANLHAVRFGGCLDATLERRPDGSLMLRSSESLGDFPARLTDRLEHWAGVAPERPFAAQRDSGVPGGGDWVRITYGAMLDRVRRIGQALVDRGLSIEKPVAILSDNDLEHLSLTLGAMWAGVPVAPISSAYSLVATDYAKLRHILGTITPGLVFACGPAYAAAIESTCGQEVEVVLSSGVLAGRQTTRFEELLAAEPNGRGDAAHAGVGPDTIAKFMFTSGTTQQPKAVINTHRMLCASQQMLCQTLAFVRDTPPVLVDWLPWNHTFGGNHNVGLVLYNGGTLYIDEGKPTPKGIETTLRNLREISPTIYFNVPKGFEEIASAMDSDAALRERLFSRVSAFMYAGAGLSQAVRDHLDRLALGTVGERIPIITGLGMTEMAPSCTFAVHAATLRSGYIGLPCPGVEARLVPDGDGPFAKTEIRFRGPNRMPGYWRAPELTAQAFDEEGFYRTGDAVRWVNPEDISQGLAFDGRLAEDFKLDTGTFVSVGPLRMKVLAECGRLVQDVVLTGLNRAEIAVLLFPRLDECCRHAQLPAGTDARDVLAHPAVRASFQQAADRLWRAGTGSANRVARLLPMTEPPSVDAGELTEKGSINQRAVLANRATLVEAVYAGTAAGLILPQRI